MILFLFLLLALPVLAQPNPPPQTNALPTPSCVAWVDNSNYCRVEYGKWFLTNWVQDSPLYYQGNLQSTEPGGNASIDFLTWPSKRMIKVGVVDNDHGLLLDGLVSSICDAQVLHFSGDYAEGIRSAVSNGCQVICLAWNTGQQGGLDNFSNACWEASASNVVLVCSVPNSDINIDSLSTPSYPGSWNLPLSLAVTASTRRDTVASPAGVGTNVIAAPGRQIVMETGTNLVFGNGASYSAAIAAGVVAWLMGQFDQTPQVIVQAIRNSLVPIDSRIAGRISMQRTVDVLRPKVKITVTVEGFPGAVYALERSTDLAHWDYLGTVAANSSWYVEPGFYRAKTL